MVLKIKKELARVNYYLDFILKNYFLLYLDFSFFLYL